MAVQLSRYEVLPVEFRTLIEDWFNHAWNKRFCEDKDSFKSFIYCWIAFNAWGACVTREDRDGHILKELCRCEALNDKFDALLSKPDHPLLLAATAFQELWPIFKVQEFRSRSIRERGSYATRAERVRDYIAQGARYYEPKLDLGCNPVPIGREIPLTWPNSLNAIYKVRCNLFHGEKSLRDEQDQRIVAAAFRVLVYFFNSILNEDSGNL
jgi:hypothetical protein